MTEQLTQIVLLGGSGDLSKRKLLPALIDLFDKGFLPENFSITGIARTPRTDFEYHEFVKDSILKHDNTYSEDKIKSFCEHISYIDGAFDDVDTFNKLNQTLKPDANKIFYLAIPPNVYELVFDMLHNTGLAKQTNESWTRILVEKPFGKDLVTAQALDKKLSEYFNEDQIYRIDHYLAKEAVQNILSFRFANTLYNSNWNGENIAFVDIKILEEIDVSNRASFYDGVGALRDIGQNHALQLLALTAMEAPDSLTPNEIRCAREKVLKAIKPLSNDDIKGSTVRGQYAGYLEHDGVEKGSDTETFFSLKAEIDLPEWRDVPFFITAGKALHEAKVSIRVVFKDIATGPFDTSSCKSTCNEVILTISPEQTIEILLNAKAPGLGYQLETRKLSFTCTNTKDEIKNSYEKVLYDCILGDQTLFTTTEEVLAAWKFITPILEKWTELPLETYEVGTDFVNNLNIPS